MSYQSITFLLLTQYYNNFIHKGYLNKTECEFECKNENGFILKNCPLLFNETESFLNVEAEFRNNSKILNKVRFEFFIDGGYNFENKTWNFGNGDLIEIADWKETGLTHFPKYPVMNDLGYILILNRKGHWSSLPDDNLYFDIQTESSTDDSNFQYQKNYGRNRFQYLEKSTNVYRVSYIES